jgi:hypothetical protein
MPKYYTIVAANWTGVFTEWAGKGNAEEAIRGASRPLWKTCKNYYSSQKFWRENTDAPFPSLNKRVQIGAAAGVETTEGPLPTAGTAPPTSAGAAPSPSTNGTNTATGAVRSPTTPPGEPPSRAETRAHDSYRGQPPKHQDNWSTHRRDEDRTRRDDRDPRESESRDRDRSRRSDRDRSRGRQESSSAPPKSRERKQCESNPITGAGIPADGSFNRTHKLASDEHAVDRMKLWDAEGTIRDLKFAVTYHQRKYE